MALYLCIDGGGTKTSATVAHVVDGGQTVTARGEGGPSNTTFGTDNCIAQTTKAITAALAKLDLKPAGGGDASSQTFAFDAVWAAYAGCARPTDRAALRPALEELFTDTALRLTGDAELLAAPIVSSGLEWGITLICGTGSLALLWHREAGSSAEDVNFVGDMRRVGRSGGWGSLLGDEGSGWSVGRQAITDVLTHRANFKPLRPWHKEILAHFSIDDADHLITASSRLDDSLLHSVADSERKSRIAACTPICVRAAEGGDPAAQRVLAKVAAEVVATLEPLQSQCTGKAMLVVGGGLGQAHAFWKYVEEEMRRRAWEWSEVVKLADPGMSGLESLVEQQGLQS